MRRAQPGKLTREAEQAFLAALSVTCNMSLAAAAVGADFNAFNRRRKKDRRSRARYGWQSSAVTRRSRRRCSKAAAPAPTSMTTGATTIRRRCRR